MVICIFMSFHGPRILTIMFFNVYLGIIDDQHTLSVTQLQNRFRIQVKWRTLGTRL